MLLILWFFQRYFLFHQLKWIFYGAPFLFIVIEILTQQSIFFRAFKKEIILYRRLQRYIILFFAFAVPFSLLFDTWYGYSGALY